MSEKKPDNKKDKAPAPKKDKPSGFATFKSNWQDLPQTRRNLIAMGVMVIGILAVGAYMSPFGKNHRVGYQNPKVTMDYLVKNTDTPEINKKGLIGVMGKSISCHQHTPMGSPLIEEAGLQGAVMVCHNSYSTLYDLENKTPAAVSHVLTRKDFLQGKYVERESEFTDDPYLNGEGVPTSKDYRGTNYDRGHLMPAADASHDEMAMKETFYMTNIAPQTPAHNRGIWARLEKDVRELLKRGKICVPAPSKEVFDEVPQEYRCKGTALHPYQYQMEFEQLYVTTGVLHHVPRHKDVPTIGQDGSLGTFKGSGVKIPNYFYKIILEPRTGFSAAYLIPNVPQVGNRNYHEFHIPLRELEKKYAFMTFYPALKNGSNFKSFYVENSKEGPKATGGLNGMLDRFLF